MSLHNNLTAEHIVVSGELIKLSVTHFEDFSISRSNRVAEYWLKYSLKEVKLSE